MKIGIYGAIDVGKVHDLSLDYIAVDKGLQHLLSQNIEPIYMVGDMDSLEDPSLLEHLHYKRVPSIKDDTDTALAIDYD